MLKILKVSCVSSRIILSVEFFMRMKLVVFTMLNQHHSIVLYFKQYMYYINLSVKIRSS